MFYVCLVLWALGAFMSHHEINACEYIDADENVRPFPDWLCILCKMVWPAFAIVSIISLLIGIAEEKSN